MTLYVLDTNIVSLIIRRDTVVQSQYRNIIQHDDIVIRCPMVWYEVQRWLLTKGATAQLARFRALFSTFEWQDYTREDWSLASTWWAQHRKSGKPIADADLLIAVFAHNRNAILVSDNVKDFVGLGVTVENWKET
jgi:tRNA(fMet)-specific endonuclease VapC